MYRFMGLVEGIVVSQYQGTRIQMVRYLYLLQGFQESVVLDPEYRVLYRLVDGKSTREGTVR